jgi:HNH endonuclease
MYSLGGIDHRVGGSYLIAGRSGKAVAIKVYKIADVVADHVALCGKNKHLDGADALALLNLQPAVDADPASAWKIEVTFRKGAADARMTLDLAPLLSKSYPIDTPICLGEDGRTGRSLLYFRDRLFASERSPKSASEITEIFLRIKKAVYDEEIELSSLRAAVANLEATIEYQKFGPRRDPIPEDVKLLVWARDGGSCVRCGAKADLHFDHVIPLAKGGGNTAANIQILCQRCNLRKSDKIAVTY